MLSSVKVAARAVVRPYLRATAAWRALPNFIVIGTQKGGTTSLLDYLVQHPQIRRAFAKELHFFDGGRVAGDDTYARGAAAYRANFPYRAALGREGITGEASPRYLFDPRVPLRIHALTPDARLIAILRNPTERAISHYFHEVRAGRESRPIMQALREEDADMRVALAADAYQSPAFVQRSYKARGRYCEQIERYFCVFPREQLLILGSRDLLLDPRAVLREVFAFLGVDPGCAVADLSSRNVGNNRSEVTTEVRAYLDAYFAEPNRRLHALLGRELNW